MGHSVPKKHAMKSYRGCKGKVLFIHFIAWDGSECLASHSSCLYPSTHWIGDWADCRAILNVVMKKKGPVTLLGIRPQVSSL